jgi:phage terminase large subunit GpA-like protein
MAAHSFRLPPAASAVDVRLECAGILKPPPDIDVAEAAERYRHLYNPGGGYSGPWRNQVVPYLREMMQALTDPRYEQVVEVAPAQSAKTELGLNFAGYAIEVDPSDFQIVLPEKQLAEDFSGRRLGRMIEHSPAYAARLQEQTKYAATFDRCIVNLSWPTSVNASSKPVPRNWLDERDSMTDDVDGEGDPVALYHKRSQTFGARRMTLVTSSPKRPPIKGAPPPSGPHEAPATTGVLALYNQGTRRQLYWPCRQCGTFFVTRAKDLRWHDEATADDVTIEVTFACPDCGYPHGEHDRRALWDAARWLAEGETIDAEGVVSGAPRNTTIDSYWLFGPQAAFITLEELAKKRLRAERERQRTGSDAELRTYWNVDAGEVYVPEGDDQAQLSPDELKAVAPDLARGVVPEWGEVLLAAVDVQSARFEIGWLAYGKESEAAFVDLQKLVAIAPGGKPVLTGAGGGGAVAGELEVCDPATKVEHWLALVEAVFDKPLPLAADPSKGLLPRLVVIDTGGKDGVTDKAYKFGRWLRRNRPDLLRRVMFIKGRGKRNPARVAPAPQWDAKTSNKKATNRRGVDLWFVWTNDLKDAVTSRLRRAVKQNGERGPDTLHLSRHLPEAVFEQVCAESVNDDGEWENVRKVPNEALDLSVYAHAAWLRLRGDRVDWSNPPAMFRAVDQAKDIESGGPDTRPASDSPTGKPESTPAPVTAPPKPPRRVAGVRPRRGGFLSSWRF